MDCHIRWKYKEYYAVCNGYNFLEELLKTNGILDDLSHVLPYESDCYGIETPEYIYANYFLCRKITSIERQQLLSSIAEHFPQ